VYEGYIILDNYMKSNKQIANNKFDQLIAPDHSSILISIPTNMLVGDKTDFGTPQPIV
jgi:hypothetical protein